MFKRFLQWLPAILIISLSLSLSYYWLSHKPKAKRHAIEKIIPLVTVITPKAQNYQTNVIATGTVTPSQQVNLTSRINGLIISVSPHFYPGDFFKKGEQIVQLDPTDYKLTVKQKENQLAKAQFDLAIEQGRQAIARREFALLNTQLDPQGKKLVLRKPHLALAKSAISAAKAALKQARLNLQRTKTIAPFNSIVLATNAHIGSWVSTFSTGTPLVKLAGTDSFWIEVSLPVDKITKINIPLINSPTGSDVKISYDAAWGKGVYRMGTVKRLKAELETSGRMAQLLVEVKDPFSQKPENTKVPPLILGSFVHVEIVGHQLKNVLSIPQSAIYEGQKIWILNKNNTLDIQTIHPIWQEQDQVFIKANDLPPDTAIINSYLNTPVQGMQLRLKSTHE